MPEGSEVVELKKRLFLTKVDKYLETLAYQMGLSFFQDDPKVGAFHDMIWKMLRYRGIDLDECLDADPQTFAKIMYELEPTTQEILELGLMTPEELKQHETVAKELSKKISQKAEERAREEKWFDDYLERLVRTAHLDGVLN